MISENVLAKAKQLWGPLTDRKLANNLGVGVGTIGRIRHKKTGITLETLETIATNLQVMPYQFFVEVSNWSNPPVIRGASAEERALTDKLGALRHGIEQLEKTLGVTTNKEDK